MFDRLACSIRVSLSCKGYSLLNNFSAFRTASFLAKTQSDAGVDGPLVPNFVKEFIIYVKDTRILNVTFTPTPNSYAFINVIEIVSMPGNLYFNSSNLNYVGQTTGPVIDNKKALENMYRLNMGGGHISGTDDTGMYRSWEQDNRYIYGAAIWWTPVYAQLKSITYTMETPNYTLPS
ncbi:putative non-specific serine/threonine protein kinase [Helianthus anomalus]